MRFRQLWLALALACSTLALPSCTTFTNVERVWRSPEWDGSFEYVAVFAVTKRPGVRRGFEDGVAKALARAGVRAVPSYRLFPGDGELAQEDIDAKLAEHGIDGALVARLVAIDTQQRYVAGAPYMLPGPGLGFYGYYHTIYGIVYSPMYSIEEQVVTIESNLYEVAGGELVWSGISATIDPQNIEQAVRSYAKAMTKTLVREGLVRAD